MFPPLVLLLAPFATGRAAVAAPPSMPGWSTEEVELADGERVKVRRIVEADTGDFIFRKAALHGALGYAPQSWPPEWPFSDESFKREDDDDEAFFATPRLLDHLGEGPTRALTHFYKSEIPAGSAVLDVCAGWDSFFPADFPRRMRRIAGVGMNEVELKANPQLSEFKRLNLNQDPTLPFADGSFDFVVCAGALSMLVKPRELFREVNRVLVPGGAFVTAISNRCFPSIATAIWRSQDDLGHCLLAAAYFHYSGGFLAAEAYDLTPIEREPGEQDSPIMISPPDVFRNDRTADTLMVVQGTKLGRRQLDAPVRQTVAAAPRVVPGLLAPVDSRGGGASARSEEEGRRMEVAPSLNNGIDGGARRALVHAAGHHGEGGGLFEPAGGLGWEARSLILAKTPRSTATAEDLAMSRAAMERITSMLEELKERKAAEGEICSAGGDDGAQPPAEETEQASHLGRRRLEDGNVGSPTGFGMLLRHPVVDPLRAQRFCCTGVGVSHESAGTDAWGEWLSSWRQHLDDWWALLPLETSAKLQDCALFMGGALASKFDLWLLLKRLGGRAEPPPPRITLPDGSCDSLMQQVEDSIPDFPDAPGGLKFWIPPLFPKPSLMPRALSSLYEIERKVARAALESAQSKASRTSAAAAAAYEREESSPAASAMQVASAGVAGAAGAALLLAGGMLLLRCRRRVAKGGRIGLRTLCISAVEARSSVSSSPSPDTA